MENIEKLTLRVLSMEDANISKFNPVTMQMYSNEYKHA